MNFIKVFKEIKKDFGEDVAIITSIILAINYSKKIKPKHLQGKGLFAEEVIKKAKTVLYSIDPEIVNTAITCWKCTPEFITTNDLEGLGGCKKKSFKQLVTEYADK